MAGQTAGPNGLNFFVTLLGGGEATPGPSDSNLYNKAICSYIYLYVLHIYI